MLFGRDPELRRIDDAIARAEAGESSALVFVGDPGIGKSSLLAAARERGAAAGLTVLTAHGVESERSLAFGGLTELIAPLAGLRERIPEVQARAIGVALALEEGPAPDQFAVAAGVLSLLSAAAEEAPLMIAVDDAQWLDRPSLAAVLFAARRLRREGVAVVVGSRPTDAIDPQDRRIERIELIGVDDDAAGRIVDASEGELAASARMRLLDISSGNPLALVEIARGLTAEQRSGGELIPDLPRPGAAIEESFRGRLDGLPAATGRALVVAAAAEDVEVAVLAGALSEAGLDSSALEAAEAEGVISTEGGRMVFSHPVLRAVAYHRGSPTDRRAAHAAIAAAVPADDDSRRAWHLAEAATGPDEAVAAVLVGAAEDARGRGALASAGELLERAATLSPDSDRWVSRTLAAALDLGRSGDPQRALDLLDGVVGAASDPALEDTVNRVRGLILIRFGQLELSSRLLLDVADSRAADDPSTAARALIETSLRDRVAGDFAGIWERSLRATELAGRADPPDPDTVALAEVHGAFAHLVAGSSAGAGEALERNEAYLLAGDPLIAPEVLSGALHTAIWVERHDWAARMLTTVIEDARRRSAIAELAYPLAASCQLEARLGNLGPARAQGDEALRLARDTQQTLLFAFGAGLLAEAEAALGLDEAREHAEDSIAFLDAVGAIGISTFSRSALGLFHVVRGDAEAALGPLRECRELHQRLGLWDPRLVQWPAALVEALVRAGEIDEATEITADLERAAEALGGWWTPGAAARSRGLIGDDADLDLHFGASVSSFREGGCRFEEARSNLLWGERLRRARRRADSREPLRAALTYFRRAGCRPLAERAQRELEATGETVAGHAPELRDQLTPHELRVAMRVADGRTNPEVASELFVSRKTVEHHLSQVYRKLGVRSRTELARVLAPALPEHPETSRALASS
ncbi:MAG: LuxR family transcriptional regulator [Solirubrobacterales bacterium]